MHRKVQFLTKLRKCSCPVLLLNIIQSGHCDHVLILVWKTHLCVLHRLQKIQKDKPHRCLIDTILVSLPRYQRVDDIFKQILDLQHLCHFEMKIFSLPSS